MMQEGLESVGDNGLISIAKIYAISAHVATVGMNEIVGARVILTHGGQSCARECTLKWLAEVETDVQFTCATFELLVKHRWNMEAVVLTVEKYAFYIPLLFSNLLL